MAGGIGGTRGPSVVYPRCWVRIGGARIACLEVSVSRSARRSSDSFTATLSISETKRYGYDLAKWADFDPEDASVIFSTAIDGSDERVMITGRVDEPQIRLKENIVTITGRDKSSGLVEKRRNEKFANQDVKSIIEKIAKDHKLKPDVKLKSSEGQDYAGKKYDQDTAHLILNRTDWEVLDDLAEREGARWYVDGDTLRFEPTDEHTGDYTLIWYPPETAAAYGIANVIDLRLIRNMSAARPQKVRVKSWHDRRRKLFKAEAIIPGLGSEMVYEDHHSGKTQEQAEQLAKSRLKSAIRHELKISAEMPGDLSVDVRQKLTLSGTGTIFDQAYDIDDVNWNMSWRGGFDMTLDATGAKEGREVSAQSSAKGGKGVTEGGPATKTVPLPPQRPASLGGAGGTSV